MSSELNLAEYNLYKHNDNLKDNTFPNIKPEIRIGVR